MRFVRVTPACVYACITYVSVAHLRVRALHVYAYPYLYACITCVSVRLRSDAEKQKGMCHGPRHNTHTCQLYFFLPPSPDALPPCRIDADACVVRQERPVDTFIDMAPDVHLIAGLGPPKP